ncbi:MAG: alpha/beta hydrolase, partial [Lachnospira sp.]|nr:alpha/beta hydrolase [Lachnospira sp.]
MGVVKEKRKFLSSDGHTQINTVIWHPDNKKFKKPVAVLQLVHGMVDYIERYEELAVYMAERGFLVAGNDHLGH